MRIALATDAWTPQTNGVVTDEDLALAVRGALKLDRRVCAERAATFTWDAATMQFLAGLAPIPAALRATLAASRSSVIIGRLTARLAGK